MRACAPLLPLVLLAMCVGTADASPQVSSTVLVAETCWRPVDAETGKLNDVYALAQLARDFPNSGSVRLRLLSAQIAADNFEGAMQSLGWLYDAGYVFSEATRQRIPELLAGIEAGRIAEQLRVDEAPIERSVPFATVPAEAGLVESVLVDLDTGRIGATSVSGRSIWAMESDETWRNYVLEGAHSPSGIVSDPVTRMVWTASGNISDQQASADLQSGLTGIGGPDPEPVFVPAPEGVALSDLHIAADGTLYASDPIGGGVYRMAAGSRQIEAVIAPGTFRSPQGLATSSDGASLYVSDYRYGLAVIDLADGSVRRVTTGLPIILDGIDGLWRNGTELIAVQNGTSPMRIAALELSEDGASVIGYRILEQAHPDWTEPLSGFVGGGALYYVANGQWENYVAGKLGEGKHAVPAEIRRLPLD